MRDAPLSCSPVHSLCPSLPTSLSLSDALSLPTFLYLFLPPLLFLSFRVNLKWKYVMQEQRGQYENTDPQR